MSVTVRMFAALRAAAGTARTTSRAGRLEDLLDELRGRYGEPFASRLALARVVVDGREVPMTDPVDLEAADEVVLLPPFSGG